MASGVRSRHRRRRVDGRWESREVRARNRHERIRVRGIRFTTRSQIPSDLFFARRDVPVEEGAVEVG